MITTTRQITFQPVRSVHLPMLRRWLHAPHVRQWWGEDPEEEFGDIIDMLEGRDPTRPYIFFDACDPIGYIQQWQLSSFCCDPWLQEAPWIKAFPPATQGVDILVGDPARIGQGLGSTALHQFCSTLSAESGQLPIIDPDIANTRAIAAYTRAGFKPVPSLLGTTGDTLIMQFTPART